MLSAIGLILLAVALALALPRLLARDRADEPDLAYTLHEPERVPEPIVWPPFRCAVCKLPAQTEEGVRFHFAMEHSHAASN